MILLSEIAKDLGLSFLNNDSSVDALLTDSRKLIKPATTLFFALSGERRDGHFFIADLYLKGVRSFVVQQDVDVTKYPEAIFLKVDNVLVALQIVAQKHREKFHYPVIGITGSNGKTIVKEWLYFLLQDNYKIVRSPKSYNSQIGVPLSVWQMDDQYNLAIFEAGISQPNEMQLLENIIQPTIGLLTNIGTAHDDGFNSVEEKIAEKLKLFSNAEVVIVQGDDEKVLQQLQKYQSNIFSWGREVHNNIIVQSIIKNAIGCTINIEYAQKNIAVNIPFSDSASIENAISCLAVLLYLNVDDTAVLQKFSQLPSVSMRLAYLKGINHCIIINDSYSADTNALKSALEWMRNAAYDKSKTVILSDFAESKNDINFYERLIQMLKQNEVKKLITIGNEWSSFFAAHNEYLNSSAITVHSFLSTDEFLNYPHARQFSNEIILIKGARYFHFEDIATALELKQHQTVLEINLNAIGHNLKQIQNHLKPTTKVMVMVKAFAYGSGAVEIANILQFHKVDYLGVAYADEGVELRKAGITIPIMIMNPEETAFETIVEHQLDPNIYALSLFKNFQQFIIEQGIKNYPVHLEMETGMNRLGFSLADIDELCQLLKEHAVLHIQSAFSHLVASEDVAEDQFTRHQFNLFQQMIRPIQAFVNYSFLTHISNTAAIMRFPELQLDMVRLGIGLYGVGDYHWDLIPAITLKSTIAQVKHLKKGDTVSYNRKGVIEKDTTIATIRLGYADGYSRKLGYGNGEMLVNSTLAPVVGTVCMDMTMIDVTNVPGVKEGDEVIVFGKKPSVTDVAQKLGTIPYEVMTNISQRVKRVYYMEE